MKLSKKNSLFTLLTILILIGTVDEVFAEETERIEIEIKYTNGDRADFTEMSLIVYQDSSKVPFLEKKLESNPDFIMVPQNHKYKIEVYANGMYADIAYIQLDSEPEKLNINIPLSGGLQFEIYYEDGSTPISDATVILKSHDNSEWRRAITNDEGETLRYWIQSTTKQEEYYVAEVFLEGLFLTTYSPIKLEPGLAVNQKIVVDIPEIVEDLITINLFDGSKKVTSSNGDYSVTLLDLKGNNIITADVNFRGNAQFGNLKAGTYTVKITSDNPVDEILWPQNKIHIIGDLNNFNIYKNSKEILDEEYPFLTCNCIAFRLDDVQDYWLADTQIEIMNLFAEKEIPLTIGVIGSLIGSDDRITSIIQNNLNEDNIEIVNHSWNNDVLVNQNKDTQEKYIIDTNKQIFEVFQVTPTSFVPPENLYDQTTIEVLKTNGFTHVISHIDENIIPSIDDSFYNVPAITETALLVNDDTEWKLQEKDHILNEIIQGINQNGYAIIMMHPQEFSLNEQGEYDIPNQKSLLELSLLLDDVKKLELKLIKINEVKPIEDTEKEEVFVETELEIDEIVIIEEEKIDSCNCIAFRLDDVQDYWLNEVQIELMQTFIDNKIPLTVGIIANAFGNDQKITEFVKQHIINNKKYIEIATKGIGLESFTNYDKAEQNTKLGESIELIETSTGVRPNVFIPPNNKFNSDTFDILEENNITHISSSLINGDSPPFEFSGQNFYRFPQITTTGEYNPTNNLFEGISNKQIINESVQGISNYGFSVISLHPQEFSNIENSTYVNSINQEQMEKLVLLIDEIEDRGYKMVSIGKINSNLVILLPNWIKDNAGWWAEDAIDDQTFVQGIEYLVQENIIETSEKSQTDSTEKNIPTWIKDNAGWWAEDAIDDQTFVQGIEYLVRNGIITY